MSTRVLLTTFHGGSAALMCWGLQQLHSLPVDEWISRQKGGHYQYLTNQGLVLAAITMGLSLLTDLVPFALFKQMKRALLLIALPLAVVISSIYWTLLSILPALILPKEQDLTVPPSGEPSSKEMLMLLRIPLNLDLTLHASPVLALLVDFFLLEKRYSGSAVKTAAPLAAILYGIGYAYFVEYCASVNGHFPYPFLEVPLFGRVLIYAGATMVALFSFRGLNHLHI